MSRRTDRVNELLRKEIGWIMATEMRDPRLAALVTVTRADVSSDLRQATIYVSVLGNDEDKRTAIDTLRSASGFLQRELKPRLLLRYVPHLVFKLDESIEQAMRMQQLMDAVQEQPKTAE